MREVTKDEFYIFVGPRDIILKCERDFTSWQTRYRREVGRTTPGYYKAGLEPRRYFIVVEH